MLANDMETLKPLEMAIKSSILMELDGFREKWCKKKSFLGVLVFGHPYCSRSNSIEFNAD